MPRELFGVANQCEAAQMEEEAEESQCKLHCALFNANFLADRVLSYCPVFMSWKRLAEGYNGLQRR